MTPSTTQDQLSAYLDGELTDEEVRTLEQALEGDADLRKQLARLERVQNLLRAHGPVLAPEGFTARVQAAVADEPGPSVPWWRGRSLEGAALLLAAAAALMITIPGSMTMTDGLSGPSRETTSKEDRYSEGSDAVAAAPVEEERSPRVGSDTPTDEDQADRADADSTLNADLKKADNAKQAPITGSVPSKPASKESPKSPPSKLLPDASNTKQIAPVSQGYGTANTALDPETLASAGLQYRVYVETTEALAVLQRLAGKHGTSIQTESGEYIKSGTLTRSETSVYVTVPADSASAFANDLASLGKVQYESSTDMIRGPNPRIRIDLILIGGMGTDADVAPNASRSAEQQHLDVEPHQGR